MKKILIAALLIYSATSLSNSDCSVKKEKGMIVASCTGDAFLSDQKAKESLISQASELLDSELRQVFEDFKLEFGKEIYEAYGKPLEFDSNILVDVLDSNSELRFGVHIGTYCPSFACFTPKEDSILITSVITSDAFYKQDKLALMSTYCHEIGHGLAGGTKYSFANAYIEGEADYFIPKCMLRLLNNGYISEDDITESEVDEDVKKVCQDDQKCRLILQAEKNASKYILSARSTHGYKFLESAYFNGRFSKNVEEPSYLKKDKSIRILDETNHPNFQCRLDTVKAGYFNTKKPRCWNGIF